MSKRITFLILLAVIGIGIFLRFYQITEVPPGLYPDEAMNGNNALEALATGEFKVFYPENNGREGLLINLQAISIQLFGNEPWALRVVSAFFGVFTILGIYLVTKELFIEIPPQTQNSKLKTQNNNSKSKTFQFLAAIWRFALCALRSDNLTKVSRNEIIALLSSFFLATSYWHLNFSRIGFRATLLPFFATFGLYFLLKGLREGKIINLVWAGIFTGFGFYSYIGFRFMPFVLAIPLVWYLWQWLKNRNYELRIKNYGSNADSHNSLFPIPNSKTCLPCLIILFLFITLVVTLPLGIYFLQNPQDFIGRSGQVSVFSAISPLKEFIKSNLLTLQMFFLRGDCNWRHNYACRPELNILVAAFFVIGLAMTIISLFKPTRNFQIPISNFQTNPNDQNPKRFENCKLKIENLTLLGWFAFMTLPATLTREGLPHALRSIGLIPPVMIFSAMGAYWLGQKILSFFEKQKQKWPKYLGRLERIQKELTLLFVLVLFLIPLTTYRDYFLRWAGNPNTYSAFSTDLLNLGRFLNNLPQDTKKYVMVNLNGIDIRGFPAPAQTVMFATDTFREEARLQKNIVYVTRESWINILRILPDQKVLIAFLDGTDRQLIHTIEKQFTGFQIKVPGDFVVLQNY